MHHRSVFSTIFLQFNLERQYHCGMFLCLMPWQVVFSKLVDGIIIASLLFKSVLSFVSCITWTRNVHKYWEYSLAHSLLKMTVLARSLLGQSGFFLHDLPSTEWYSLKIKTLLYLQFSFVINLLVCFKSDTLLWSEWDTQNV